ncbi:MAG: N-acetylmuramoyl-L-alanine amidase [Alphaproteobacteria bacterium]
MTRTRLISGIFALLGLLLVPVVVQAVKSEPAFISSLRIGVHPDHTRIVLDLSAQPKTQIFTLSAPDRVVLDLAGAQFTMKTPGPIPKAGLVDQYRFGLFRPGLSRLVLDLRKPVTVKQHFFLPATDGGTGKRMVIDLAPVSRANFDKQAGFPKTALKAEPSASGNGVAQPQPSAQPQPVGATRPKNRRPVIVLDAGHGGVDPGAIGRSGTREKDVVFDVTKRLQRKLQATGRYDVYLTRDRDILIPLRERVRRARARNADLFISIHADSAENPKAHGAGVYTLSERSSDKEAAALARRENRADIIAGVNLEHETHEVTNILIDLAQRETKNRSAAFAETLVPQLRAVTDNRSKPHRFAGFVVLKAPDVPSVLIELGFLTNRTEERRLRSSQWRDQMVAAIGRAVDNYFKNHPVVAYGD